MLNLTQAAPSQVLCKHRPAPAEAPVLCRSAASRRAAVGGVGEGEGGRDGTLVAVVVVEQERSSAQRSFWELGCFC